MFEALADEHIGIGEIIVGELDSKGQWHLMARRDRDDAMPLGIAARDIEVGDTVLFSTTSNTRDIIRATTRVTRS